MAPALTFEEHRAIPAGLSPFLLRADTLGNQLGVGPGAPQAAPGDSAPVVRLRAAATTVDTVGFVERLQTAPIQIGQMGMMAPAEYAPRDLWGVDHDGTVWIARGSRRVLEFISREGTLTTFPLPFAPIPTVDADRALFRGLPAPEGLDRAARELAPIKGPFQEVRADLSGRYFPLAESAGGLHHGAVCRVRSHRRPPPHPRAATVVEDHRRECHRDLCRAGVGERGVGGPALRAAAVRAALSGTASMRGPR
ncbi:MAG: hypothetical protein IPG05_14470 [Gemmatimonadetes bacterium]|nr:hypothetical protein [Gemmatimonadota bacterium]